MTRLCACTFGHESPVLCTYISDAPLQPLEPIDVIEALNEYNQFLVAVLKWVESLEDDEYEERGHEIMRSNIKVVTKDGENV